MKAIIVTGAAGGLGTRTVEALAERGASVLAVDLDPRVEALAGRRVSAVVADVTDALAVRAYVDTAVERFGRLDAIFNNAATLGPIAPVQDYPEEALDRLLQINVKSVFLGMKYAVPALLASGGGAILNTASTGGMMGWPNISGYVSSKHAVVGLTRTVALEMAGKGVRVNCLCPGPMDTTMIWEVGEAMAPGDRSRQQELLEATIPIGRLGRPEEVASFAAWLLTEGPEYLTGAVLPVDGAQTTG